ncbi:unnamed protein product [Closterium sp. NIES-54]
MDARRTTMRQLECTHGTSFVSELDDADAYSEDSSISDEYDDVSEADDDDDIGGSSNEETDLEDLYRAWLSSPLPSSWRTRPLKRETSACEEGITESTQRSSPLPSSWRTRPLKRELSAKTTLRAEHRGNFSVAKLVESSAEPAPRGASPLAAAPVPPNQASASASASPRTPSSVPLSPYDSHDATQNQSPVALPLVSQFPSPTKPLLFPAFLERTEWELVLGRGSDTTHSTAPNTDHTAVSRFPSRTEQLFPPTCLEPTDWELIPVSAPDTTHSAAPITGHNNMTAAENVPKTAYYMSASAAVPETEYHNDVMGVPFANDPWEGGLSNGQSDVPWARGGSEWKSAGAGVTARPGAKVPDQWGGGGSEWELAGGVTARPGGYWLAPDQQGGGRSELETAGAGVTVRPDRKLPGEEVGGGLDRNFAGVWVGGESALESAGAWGTARLDRKVPGEEVGGGLDRKMPGVWVGGGTAWEVSGRWDGEEGWALEGGEEVRDRVECELMGCDDNEWHVVERGVGRGEAGRRVVAGSKQIAVATSGTERFRAAALGHATCLEYEEGRLNPHATDPHRPVFTDRSLQHSMDPPSAHIPLHPLVHLPVPDSYPPSLDSPPLLPPAPVAPAPAAAAAPPSLPAAAAAAAPPLLYSPAAATAAAEENDNACVTCSEAIANSSSRRMTSRTCFCQAMVVVPVWVLCLPLAALLACAAVNHMLVQRQQLQQLKKERDQWRGGYFRMKQTLMLASGEKVVPVYFK